MCCNDKCRCCCSDKPNPAECTPEQILECHGEVTEHPCQTQAPEPTKD